MLPDHVLINKMKQDGVKDPEQALKILKGEAAPAPAPAAAIVVEIPEELQKYVKMMKMLPEHALINKMKQDGIKDADNAMKILKGEAAAPTKKAKPKKPRKKSVSIFLSIFLSIFFQNFKKLFPQERSDFFFF